VKFRCNLKLRNKKSYKNKNLLTICMCSLSPSKISPFDCAVHQGTFVSKFSLARHSGMKHKIIKEIFPAPNPNLPAPNPNLPAPNPNLPAPNPNSHTTHG
jgi:hypothetical protein